jgi:hypothetical protein
MIRKVLLAALLASIGFMAVWSFDKTKDPNVVAGWTADGTKTCFYGMKR